jgi:sulfotransferase family protein
MRPVEAAAAAVERSALAGPLRVLFIGGIGRSGSTLLDRMLGRLDDVWSVGELVHVWERGLQENNLCGCGERFRDCAFWHKVGEEAFGGWNTLDVDEVLALKRAVDRNRYVPLMVLPALWPSYQARLRRYLGLLDRLYGAVRQVAGRPLLIDASKHASHALLLRRLPGLDLRLVHLVRDSRGVAFSWTKPMRRTEVADREVLMRTYTPLRMNARYVGYNLLLHLVRGLGVSTVLLRYESLVANPAGELTRVLGHAGRPPADGELGFVGDGWVELGSNHALAGNPMRFRSGRVPLRVDEEWRGKLRRWHRLVTLGSTWPLLLRYGYLRGRRR